MVWKICTNLQYLLVTAVVSIFVFLYWLTLISETHSNIKDAVDDKNMMNILIPVERPTNNDSAVLFDEGSVSPTLGSTKEVTTENAIAPTSQTNQQSDSKSEVDTSLKTILFWNSWYHMNFYGFGSGTHPFHEYDCPEKRCRTTDNVDELNKADAVVVCGRLLKWDAEQVVPPRRDPDQVFVYFNNEGPVKTLGKTDRLNNIFNITMTHRLDSTIPFPYSEIVPKKDKSNYRPVTKWDIRHKSHTHLVSWMVSRCNKPGCVRHEYADALSKHTPVDVYGRCGNLTCERYDNGSCMDYQERRYKFYLAFENTICEDYVTEKAFRTLKYNIVPVVMGGANYTKIMPPHSFIDVRDFNSPEELAAYLQYLDHNDSEYLKYFEWKRDFEVRDLTIDEPICKLCELLHTEEKFNVDFNLQKWWEGGAGEACVSNQNLNFLYEYFHIDPPAVPRRRGRGPKAQQNVELLKS